jgi:hypothetical protein
MARVPSASDAVYRTRSSDPPPAAPVGASRGATTNTMTMARTDSVMRATVGIPGSAQGPDTRRTATRQRPPSPRVTGTGQDRAHGDGPLMEESREQHNGRVQPWAGCAVACGVTAYGVAGVLAVRYTDRPTIAGPHPRRRPDPNDVPPYQLTYTHAAALLGVADQTVSRWVSQGRHARQPPGQGDRVEVRRGEAVGRDERSGSTGWPELAACRTS